MSNKPVKNTRLSPATEEDKIKFLKEKNAYLLMAILKALEEYMDSLRSMGLKKYAASTWGKLIIYTIE